MAIDVVGIGVSPLDILVLVDHLPNKEEVQRAKGMTIQGGGPVATALATIAKLGARVAMLDVLGDDWRSSVIIDDFKQAGVITEYVKIIRGADSPCAFVLVNHQDHSRSIIHYPGTVSELTASDLSRPIIQSAKYLHLNGRHWEASLTAIRWAHEANVQVSFDGGAHRYRQEMKELLPLVDLCIVARDFAVRYSHKVDIPEAASALLSIGPKIVVITDGVKGSWIYTGSGDCFHQPGFLMSEVVDTTGCGDSYHGAFLFGLIKGWDLRKTACFASAVAALNSQHLGGRKGLPTLNEVQLFLENRSENVEVLTSA